MLYFGHKSVTLKIKLTELISEFFPHLDAKIVLVNPFTIGSFFRFKDVLPKSLRSGLIYKFSCEAHGTSSEYIGLTTRRLATRVAEHIGVSPRTKKSSETPPFSSIRNHSDQCICNIDLNSFKILGSDNSTFGLKILESLFIYKDKPCLNQSGSSTPLFLVP